MKESSIKHVVNFLGIFDPHFHLRGQFTKNGLCNKMVIWLSPSPPQLSTWFMNDPKDYMYHKYCKDYKDFKH